MPVEERVTALGVVVPRLNPLPDASFALLTGRLSEQIDPLSRLAAASALSQARLNDKQFRALTQIIAREGPLTTPLLAAALEQDDWIGQARDLHFKKYGAHEVA